MVSFIRQQLDKSLIGRLPAGLGSSVLKKGKKKGKRLSRPTSAMSDTGKRYKNVYHMDILLKWQTELRTIYVTKTLHKVILLCLILNAKVIEKIYLPLQECLTWEYCIVIFNLMQVLEKKRSSILLKIKIMMILSTYRHVIII